MRIQFSFVGDDPQHDDVWVELDAVPRVDDVVFFPDTGELHVRHVGWYPIADEDGDPERCPLVYVVIGPRRPT